MVTAKNEATFIVEPYGSDIDNPTGFVVKQSFQDTETTMNYATATTMLADIMNMMTRPTTSGSKMRGGLLFLKNGTYFLDSAGIELSDPTDGNNVSLRLIGESRQNTVLKNGVSSTTDTQMLRVGCSIDIENITFNGNGLGPRVFGINTNANAGSNKVLRVFNCRFTKMAGFGIIIGDNVYGLDVSHCRFDNFQSVQDIDQVALGCTGFAHIHDNYFDKTTPPYAGSSITSGGALNANIHDNIINRHPGDITHGISIEAFGNYSDILIHNNLVKHGTISVGGLGKWDKTFRRIAIESNVIFGADIRIKGPTEGDYSTQIKDLSIENNKIYDPYLYGILCSNIAGPTTIRNNFIKNSHISLDNINFDKGLIYLERCADMICERNNLYMGVTSPPNATFSPYGIKYIDMHNFTMRDNRIINRTNNPSYVSEGTHTGQMLIQQ